MSQDEYDLVEASPMKTLAQYVERLDRLDRTILEAQASKSIAADRDDTLAQFATNSHRVGFGLMLVHPIVELHGGTVDFQNAIGHIRRQPELAKIPIVALTALAMEGDRDKCLAAGANDYLTKPVKLKQLNATIQHFLSSKVGVDTLSGDLWQWDNWELGVAKLDDEIDSDGRWELGVGSCTNRKPYLNSAPPIINS